MSFFSECLSAIKDKKGLSSAEMARICNMDTTAVFRWLKGERLPCNLSKIVELQRKLRLTEQEKSELEEAYIITVCGNTSYQNFKEILKVINTLQGYRQQRIYRENSKECCGKNPSRLELASDVSMGELHSYHRKKDILQAIQYALEMTNRGKNETLYLISKDMDDEVEQAIRSFYRNIEDCSIEQVVYPHVKETSGEIYGSGGIIEKIMDVVFPDSNMRMWIGFDTDNVNNTNYIISDYFAIQYNYDMSEGMMTTYPEMIDMYKEMFQYLKRNSVFVGRKEVDSLQYVEENYSTDLVMKILENQPCIGPCLTEDLLRNHFYEELPMREEMIQNIVQTYVMEGQEKNNIIKEMNSFFTKQGLTEFMETGMLDVFPYPVYTPLTMEERCQIIRNCVKLSQKGKYRQYLLKDSSLVEMKGIHIEYIRDKEKKHVKIDTNCVAEVSERTFLLNPEIIAEFEDFFNCLNHEKYSYSIEETEEYMLQVADEYETREKGKN